MLVKFTKDATLTQYDLKGNVVGNVDVREDEEVEVVSYWPHNDENPVVSLTFQDYEFIDLPPDLVEVVGE